MPERVGVIIAAAGASQRMGGADKLFVSLGGKSLLAHTLGVFQDWSLVEEIVLVVRGARLEEGRRLVATYGLDKVTRVCCGGPRRRDSVRAGLEALHPCPWVVVHDGARPLVTRELLQRGLAEACRHGAAVAALPATDTMKYVSAAGTVERTVTRDGLWAVQTPQIFRYDLLLKAHRLIGGDVTDDAALVEQLGHPVVIYPGSAENLKVTTPLDLILAEALLRRRKDAEEPSSR